MAKTQIFKSYEDFLAREDKTLNGVLEREGPSRWDLQESAFFVSDEEALADMRRCAEEEKALASKTPR